MKRVIRSEGMAITEHGATASCQIKVWQERDVHGKFGPQVEVNVELLTPLGFSIKKRFWVSKDSLWRLKQWYDAAGLQPEETADGLVYDVDKMVSRFVRVFLYRDPESGYIRVAPFPAGDLTIEEFKQKYANWYEREVRSKSRNQEVVDGEDDVRSEDVGF